MVSLNETTVWRLHMPLLEEDYQGKLQNYDLPSSSIRAWFFFRKI
jgi:hypothetical protein